MLRLDLICDDGTCVSIPKVLTIQQDIDIYVEEIRDYRTLFTIEKDIDKIDNIWDWKYQILNKTIKEIHIYNSTTDDTGTVNEYNIENWDNVYYNFHGIYRKIYTVGNIVNNVIRLILISDEKDDNLQESKQVNIN